MKIDPTVQFPNDPQSDRVGNTPAKPVQSQSSGSSSSASSVAGGDTFSLSSAHGDVQTLTANLASVPEVRSQRVAALQQRVKSGNYKPDAAKVADAIIADQTGRK